MATVTRVHKVQLPNGEYVDVPYKVDEAEEAARCADPDYGRKPEEVVQECSDAVDNVHAGRNDVEALRLVVRRLIKLQLRALGIGTSPSVAEPVPNKGFGSPQ